MGNSSVDNADGEDPCDKTRQRTSKACDRCRKARSKCLPSDLPACCRPCLLLNIECTFTGPTHKRGPPKGYTEETTKYLNQLEALVGALIASQDPILQSIFATISQDSIVANIVEKINGSAVGERHLVPEDGYTPKKKVKGPSLLESAAFATERDPNQSALTWQDRLEDLILNRPDAAAAHSTTHRLDSSPSLPPASVCQASVLSHPPSKAEVDSVIVQEPPNHHAQAIVHLNRFADADDLSVGVGQLSMDSENHVLYHGRSSGLHLLASVVDEVDSGKKSNHQNAPHSRSSMASNPLCCILTDGHLTEQISPTDCITGLPPPEEQEYLLQLYFVHVHPHLPIVHAGDIMQSFRMMHGLDHPPSGKYVQHSRPLPRLLLLAMYAVAARCHEKTDPPISLSKPIYDPGLAYYGEARKALCKETGLNKVTTCQVLLLLTYHELGAGDISQACHLVGTAIRTAQEIGLHRSAEKWPTEVASRFSYNEKQTFRRLWHMCVIVDQIVSAKIGRPAAVSSLDHDTEPPCIDAEEDIELMELARALHPRAPSTMHQSTAMAIIPYRLAYSAIFESISLNVYSVRLETANRCDEVQKISNRLDQWLASLPDHLRYEVGLAVPPPGILIMHITYWTMRLLLSRPFIRLPDASELADHDDASIETNKQWAAFAYDACNVAAINLTTIAVVFIENYGPEKFPAYCPYYIFTASIMHVTVLLDDPENIQATSGLTRCMDILKRMEVVWPNAGQPWDLLYGWKVHLSHLEAQRLCRQSHAGKRPADEELYNTRPTPAAPGELKPHNPIPDAALDNPGYQHTQNPGDTLPYRNVVSQIGYGSSWSTHRSQEHLALAVTPDAPQNHLDPSSLAPTFTRPLDDHDRTFPAPEYPRWADVPIPSHPGPPAFSVHTYDATNHTGYGEHVYLARDPPC